jgi:hypothetical protein
LIRPFSEDCSVGLRVIFLLKIGEFKEVFTEMECFVKRVIGVVNDETVFDCVITGILSFYIIVFIRFFICQINAVIETR